MRVDHVAKSHVWGILNVFAGRQGADERLHVGRREPRSSRPPDC
jgi:hypothetical protein